MPTDSVPVSVAVWSTDPVATQRPSPRARITWLGHATARLEVDGVRLLTDPALHRFVGPLVRVGGAVPDADARLDAVLLSHLHADHTHLRSLRSLGSDVAVIAPEGAARWLRRHGIDDVEELRVGSTTHVGDVAITATPAMHDGRRFPWGPAAAAIGYLVEASRSVYFAGDTDVFEEMAELVGVDVALLPVAGWGRKLGPGHMNPERAAIAAAMIVPRVAVPIHWGTLAAWQVACGARCRSAAPAERFAELVDVGAPGVEVRVLRPGHALVV